MKAQWAECIPNFSEGRRPDVIEAIVQAIRSVPGVVVLDQSSDEDHNRTVVTFAGELDAVQEAAFASIQEAAKHINLDDHQGEHPRIGATDVVPFVPLGQTTMEQCVNSAQALAKRVGADLSIPVYLYENAALRPDRKRLESIRKGEYEGLKETIQSDPNRAPDYGPSKIGPAGATVIGARAPLIAFNAYLNTDDISIADKIARSVRHSSGGLRFVKAMGVMVAGQAQVSMNLTDFTRTPISRVVELIRSEALRYGTSVHHCELVGLIPRQALLDASRWHLQLDQFDFDQILERKLEQAQEGVTDTFLTSLASRDPTPGGGSASAYAGAMGAGLVEMVAQLSTGKKKFADIESRMLEIATEAKNLRKQLHGAVSRDAEAFDAVMQAFKLPKESDQDKRERVKAIEEATSGAALVPLEVAKKSLRVMEIALEVAEFGNLNAISDAASASYMAESAIQAAGMNVQVNAQAISDKTAANRWMKELKEIRSGAEALRGQIRQILKDRSSLS
jgi:glutamate formiminotransferase/formiminotetrahydrofolate cyclodeaminase